MKNFTCPNCKVAASLRDIIPNKKLRESITWFKTLLSESSITMNPQIVTAIKPQPQVHSMLAVNPVAYPIQQPVVMPNINFAPPGQVYSVQMTSEIKQKKSLEINRISENNEVDMTPEEKMQLYNKINENQSEGIRKPSEDKMDDNKSLSIEHKSAKEISNPNTVDKVEKQVPPFPIHPNIPINPAMMKPGDPMMFMRGN